MSNAAMAQAAATGPVLVQALPAASLYRPSDLSTLQFATTDELPPLEGLFGQRRALDAIQLGMRVNAPGFNVFVMGSPGARIQATVKELLHDARDDRPGVKDWVYVNSFADHRKPIAIELPAGQAPTVRDAVDRLIEELRTALPAIFQSEDYQTRRSALDESFQKKQADAFTAVRDAAARKNMAIMRTAFGFALAPISDGKIVPPDEFNSWPEQKRQEVQALIRELEKELEHVVRRVPQWEKERRDEILRLDREVAKIAVDQLIDDAKANVAGLPRVLDHLEAVRNDLVDNVAFLLAGHGEKNEPGEALPDDVFDRYRVNVFVSQQPGAPDRPVVEEMHPTLGNLVGEVEHVVQEGVLITNFLLLKAGALHRANGGYLLLDIRNLLSEPFSWNALKRVLKQRKIAIENAAKFAGLAATVSLEPDPIPFEGKVILFGDRLLYFLLLALDPEAGELFKLVADFENEVQRSPENEALLARLLGSLAKKNGLKPLARDAVALMLEHAARLSGDSEKLTLLVDQLLDVLIEADFYAGDGHHPAIMREDVDRAIAQRVVRAGRVKDRLQEAVQRNVVLIDTQGGRVGQINGLSVFEVAGVSFGTASRITCQVHPGAGKVVDIEREVELGGPVHSKGVLILSGFLAGRYALDAPLALHASLVFEQSYSGVEGDSASSAELFALLSAIADVPLRQDLAVTGSVNQHGVVQAIGGINEKIEGFFDICAARGLTGTQGVLIPKANVQHLMLRRDVVTACAQGRFSIYPVATIEEGITLLTGKKAGERGPDGSYEPGSINRLVEDRLRRFAAAQRRYAEPSTKAIMAVE